MAAWRRHGGSVGRSLGQSLQHATHHQALAPAHLSWSICLRRHSCTRPLPGLTPLHSRATSPLQALDRPTSR